MKHIRKEIEVHAPLAEMWRAWTTAEGAKTFFGPEARVDLRIGGPYEILFDLEQPAGKRGGEGLTVLCYVPDELVAFQWNAPPDFPTLRDCPRTWVVVQLAPDGDRVKVTLRHYGFGEGAEWDRLYAYFQRAWGLVLAATARLGNAG